MAFWEAARARHVVLLTQQVGQIHQGIYVLQAITSG